MRVLKPAALALSIILLIFSGLVRVLRTTQRARTSAVGRSSESTRTRPGAPGVAIANTVIARLNCQRLFRHAVVRIDLQPAIAREISWESKRYAAKRLSAWITTRALEGELPKQSYCS